MKAQKKLMKNLMHIVKVDKRAQSELMHKVKVDKNLLQKLDAQKTIDAPKTT